MVLGSGTGVTILGFAPRGGREVLQPAPAARDEATEPSLSAAVWQLPCNQLVPLSTKNSPSIRAAFAWELGVTIVLDLVNPVSLQKGSGKVRDCRLDKADWRVCCKGRHIDGCCGIGKMSDKVSTVAIRVLSPFHRPQNASAPAWPDLPSSISSIWMARI
jgi:hypothetical protein